MRQVVGLHDLKVTRQQVQAWVRTAAGPTRLYIRPLHLTSLSEDNQETLSKFSSLVEYFYPHLLLYKRYVLRILQNHRRRVLHSCWVF